MSFEKHDIRQPVCPHCFNKKIIKNKTKIKIFRNSVFVAFPSGVKKYMNKYGGCDMIVKLIKARC